MAFEQVRVRLTNGQEFGPVSWSAMLQWRQEGRVPDDAALVDTETGEARPVASFPELAVQVAPVPQASADALPQAGPYAQPSDSPYVTPIVPPTPAMAPQGGQWYQGGNTPPDASFNTVFDYGWRALGRNYWLAVGGGVIYFLIAFAIGGLFGALAEVAKLPFLPLLTNGFLLPPIVGGGMRFALNIFRGANPQIGDVFSGFTEYPKWLGIYWLFQLIVLVCMAPFLAFGFAGLFPFSGGEPDPSYLMGHIGLFMLIFCVMMVVYLFIFTRLAFVYPLAADGFGILDAFSTSNRMANGRMWYLIGMAILLSLLSSLGAIACGIGAIFTMPIGAIVFCSLYCAVRNEEHI